MGEALHGLRVALLSAVVGAEVGAEVSAISALEMASSFERRRGRGGERHLRVGDGVVCSPRGKS